MHQITASEVKPGMTIRWEQEDLVLQFPVAHTIQFGDRHLLRTPMRKVVTIPHDTEVTVLAEPQPEEPKAFGAKVIVNRRRFLRSPEGTYDDPPWLEEGTGCRGSWAHLCSLGTVTVIPDLGWTAPDDTPEVPDRIDEWPEDDTALRPYKWREHCGYTWKWFAAVSEWECYDQVGNYVASGWRPSCGPWDRVTNV